MALASEYDVNRLRQAWMQASMKFTEAAMSKISLSSPFGKDTCYTINQCPVCAANAGDTKLKRCGGCFRISYCSQGHQKSHWAEHKEVCKTLRKVDSMIPEGDLSDGTNWMNYRKQYIELYRKEITRPITSQEACFCYWPGRCEICRSRNALIPCYICLRANYCSEEHKNLDADYHSKLCPNLKLLTFLNTNCLTIPPPIYSLRKGTISLHGNIDEFIERSLKVDIPNNDRKKYSMILLSDLVTCPLSLIYAMKLLNSEVKETFTIHIVGSKWIETMYLMQWEIIPHMFNKIKKLHIDFIGPAVQKAVISNMCINCKQILSFGYSKQLYHQFMRNDDYQKPDIIIGFNCGIYTYPDWRLSLRSLIEIGPFITTAYVEYECDDDIKVVKEVVPDVVVRKEKNPFAGKQVLRRSWFDEFAFNNKFLAIYSKN